MRPIVYACAFVVSSAAAIGIAACSSDGEAPSEGASDASTSIDGGGDAANRADSAGDNGDAAPDARADADGSVCTVADGGVGAVCAKASDCACGTVCAAFRCVPRSACDDALLTWDGPTTRADGTCITTLAGFNIYWTRDAGADAGGNVDAGYPCLPGAMVACGDAGQTVAQPSCAYRIQKLADGDYTFSVTAYDDAGTESPPSVSASKSIHCP